MKLRHLLFGRKAMKNPDNILKSRDITLPTKFHVVKPMVFPVVMYWCEHWTIKKAERKRIVAFELCWRRLLRVPWTARIPSSSILLCAWMTDPFRLHPLGSGWVWPMGASGWMGDQEKWESGYFFPVPSLLWILVLAVAGSLCDSRSTSMGPVLTHLWSHSFHSLIF